MIARIAEGDKEDVDLAVKAARHAFDYGPWPRLSGFVCYICPFICEMVIVIIIQKIIFIIIW